MTQAEKEMAPHSSTLAWKISWAEVLGRLQSMGSLSVRHDQATSLSLFTFMHWRRKWQPTPVFLPGESQGQGSLVGSHRVGHDWSDLAAAAAVTQGNFFISSSHCVYVCVCLCVCVCILWHELWREKESWFLGCLMETVNEKYILFSKMILIDLPCLPRALCWEVFSSLLMSTEVNARINS